MASSIKKAQAVRPTRGPGALPVYVGHFAVTGGDFVRPVELQPSAPPHEDAGQWIVLLGPNGAGKTTLLRLIGLGLGRRYWHGPRRAFTMTELRLDTRAQVDHPATSTDGFAYGSSRGTALGGPDREVALDEIDAFETLYSANARLIHAETWLRREKLRASSDGRFFDAILNAVASLLPGGETIQMEGDELIVVEPSGRRIPFAAMSDGYLTTLGWTIDLIARWAHRYRDTGKLDENFAKDMPCVVLVDELDLHLHPRWQLDIIPRLRAAFPKTTFVVTTHNPLTLQGTRPGEVFVLQKDEATGQISITQRDVPPGTDANRLLTGDWFGLGSTLDESTLRKLDRHRELLLARRPEADPERRALEQELRVRLNGFADTSYERMALDVIAQLHDEKMRQRKDITAEDRERVVREVRARLAALDEPTGAREPATSAREPAPTYRPAKPLGKAPPKASGKASSKPSPRKSTAKTKPAARTNRR